MLGWDRGKKGEEGVYLGVSARAIKGGIDVDACRASSWMKGKVAAMAVLKVQPIERNAR